jgi:hypothetical protein
MIRSRRYDLDAPFDIIISSATSTVCTLSCHTAPDLRVTQVMNTRVLDEERKRLKERKKGLRIIATV